MENSSPGPGAQGAGATPRQPIRAGLALRRANGSGRLAEAGHRPAYRAPAPGLTRYDVSGGPPLATILESGTMPNVGRGSPAAILGSGAGRDWVQRRGPTGGSGGDSVRSVLAVSRWTRDEQPGPTSPVTVGVRIGTAVGLRQALEGLEECSEQPQGGLGAC
ncbi:hypothetical protein AAES_71539 [Amazona aestiva]|uniref:Uncharacterized protein n=1 Tax=Amazona aestiva TaxID=12930 RepID=A0A0Q3Q298_AMAAE|nr:hypothetical protein AAES_71539 [Amazona aestiva]